MRRQGYALPVLLLIAACQTGDDAGVGFDRFDRDGDGVITQAEFSASFPVLDLDGDGFIETDENPAVIYEADANRDGVVTPLEFEAISVSRLEADANQDGLVTRDEFVAYDRATIASLRGPAMAVSTQADRFPESRWVLFRF